MGCGTSSDSGTRTQLASSPKTSNKYAVKEPTKVQVRKHSDARKQPQRMAPSKRTKSAAGNAKPGNAKPDNALSPPKTNDEADLDYGGVVAGATDDTTVTTDNMNDLLEKYKSQAGGKKSGIKAGPREPVGMDVGDVAGN